MAIKRQILLALSGGIASTSRRLFWWIVLSKDSANLGFSAYSATDFSVTLSRALSLSVLQIPTCLHEVAVRINAIKQCRMPGCC